MDWEKSTVRREKNHLGSCDLVCLMLDILRYIMNTPKKYCFDSIQLSMGWLKYFIQTIFTQMVF